jgi:hypothetical protein
MMTKVNKTIPVPTFGHPECYAQILKCCCIQMSGEHPLSRAILERVDKELGEKSNMVDVRNMSFQPPATVENLGIRGLESKILCHHHNSRLGNYDAEGLKAFEAFERLHYAAAGRLKPEPVYIVNGDRFERFLLKALCGALYGDLFPVEEVHRFKGAELPTDWLGRLYGQRPFPAGHGLYCAKPGPGEVFTADRSIIKWGPLLLTTGEFVSVHGLRFWLFGFPLTLLAPGPEPRAVEALAKQAYRPEAITIDGAGTRVEFNWDFGPGSGEIRLRMF